ncbi:MAG TPA: inositol monophosphatase family protein [Candidatus Lumbricidophila sp.]|nr:inositol monophosphatase family protein [Candidatus Lumbricidophila sp.]
MTASIPSPHELRDIALHIAQRAAAFAQSERARGVEVAATKSSPVDIVTQVDRDTETLIRDEILAVRPNDGFFGEEHDRRSGTSGLTWVVDPIDGTVNFLYGIPAWSVSIAVVDSGDDPTTWRALAGAVVCPVLGESYDAYLDGGARRNGEPIAVNTNVPLSQALIGTGFAYAAETRREQAAVLAQLLGQVRDIRRIGAASLDLCGVASGRLDAYFERSLKPWDHAAGALIAREAGAFVTGVDGGPEGEDLIVVAGWDLSDPLRELLRSAGVQA